MKKTKISKFDQVIGKRVRNKRILLGKSQIELGKALGVSSQQIHKYETGSNRISCSSLLEIAQYLRADTSYFLECSNKEDYKDLNNIKDREDKPFIRLIKYFSQIKNKQMQAAILTLTKNIAEIKILT